MYLVTFVDKDHGPVIEEFQTFEEAQNYWDEYADTPSCVYGSMEDDETGETIWEFGNQEV